MKHLKSLTLPLFLTILFSLILFPGAAIAEEVTIELVKTSGYSRIDFDDAYTMIWSGDVIHEGSTIGDFTAQVTKTTHTGSNGSVQQYDLIIPGSGDIADFVSIRTNHIMTGSGADSGIVFATSPTFKFLIGATVEKAGETTLITW